MTVGRSGRRGFGPDGDSESPYHSWAARDSPEAGASDRDWGRHRAAWRHSAADDYQTDWDESARPWSEDAGYGGAWGGHDAEGAWEALDRSGYGYESHHAGRRWAPEPDPHPGGYGRPDPFGSYPPPDDPPRYPADPDPYPTGVYHHDEDGEAAEPATKQERRKGLPLWQELPLLLVIAFCLAVLIRTFLMQAFIIPSGSMEDTLVTGDRVLVNKLVYHFREPVRGEVVVFRGTDAWASAEAEAEVGALTRVGRTLGDLVGISHPGKKDYIKRIIGLPGDRVSCCDDEGRVLVNGQPLDEAYVIRDSPLDPPPAHDCHGRRFEELVVAPGNMFVMGDHRLVSQDSRCQGQVPTENIIGRAFVIVWPTDRWTGLSAPDTFADVPSPAAAALAPVAPITSPEAELPFLLLLAPFPRTLAVVAARSGRFATPVTRRLAA